MGNMYESTPRANVIDGVKTICSAGLPGKPFAHNYYGWPSVTRLPDGTLAMVASGFRLWHICPFGKSVLCRSNDEGKTWSAPEVVIDTPLDDRDSGIAVSGNRVIVTSFNNKVAQQKSWNDQNNKNDPKKHAYILDYLNSLDAEAAEKEFLGSLYVISEDGGKTFGPIHRLPITAPHGPCVDRDGKFLYVGTTYETRDKESAARILCYKENENGEFEYLSSVPPIKGERPLLDCEPHSTVLPDGTILVHIRAETSAGWAEFTLYQSESHDGGKTFSEPHAILPHMGGAPSHLLQHSSGTVVAVYAYREFQDTTANSEICALLSRDGGKTWENRVLTEGVHHWDLGYPASVELKDNSILTVYYDHEVRDDTKPAVIRQIVWSL